MQFKQMKNIVPLETLESGHCMRVATATKESKDRSIAASPRGRAGAILSAFIAVQARVAALVSEIHARMQMASDGA